MNEIHLISTPIPFRTVQEAAQIWFGEMVKAVVDVNKKIVALGGQMHADAEALLLDKGSVQQDLWGINLYPDRYPDDWIEYHSLINIRPKQNARSMEIQDPDLQKRIRTIVEDLIKSHD